MERKEKYKQISKRLSYILRHKPEAAGIVLDEAGWVATEVLLDGYNRTYSPPLDQTTLEEVVAENDKQRFAFNEDNSRIRANQGHSLAVDLALEPANPPAFLYHGTATRFLDSILQDGLKPGTRRHVHLSRNKTTARSVGSRHGKPVILRIDTAKMTDKGFAFFLSDNGVWLCDFVPPDYIRPD